MRWEEISKEGRTFTNELLIGNLGKRKHKTALKWMTIKKLHVFVPKQKTRKGLGGRAHTEVAPGLFTAIPQHLCKCCLRTCLQTFLPFPNSSLPPLLPFSSQSPNSVGKIKIAETGTFPKRTFFFLSSEEPRDIHS